MHLTKHKSKAKDWHKALIVARLHMQDTNLRRLSVENGFNPTALSTVLHRRWLKGESIIAKAIGVSPADIWPSRQAHREQKAANAQANKRLRIPLNAYSATADSIKECSHDCNIYCRGIDKHGRQKIS